MRQELEEQYARKMCHLADQRKSYRSYAQRDNDYCCCHHGQHEQRKLHDDGGHNDDKRNNKKSPPERKGKGFKPCHICGKHANHLYKECHANPRSQARYKLLVNNSNK